MFFTKKLSVNAIYKIALPIAKSQGRVNSSINYLSKYCNVNEPGMIALYLSLLHYISYSIHGDLSLQITQDGINKAINKNSNPIEVINKLKNISKKGPEYLNDLISKPLGEKNDNPLIYIMNLEESIGIALNSGYMFNRVTPLNTTEANALTIIDVLNQFLLFEKIFRLEIDDMAKKIGALKIK